MPSKDRQIAEDVFKLLTCDTGSIIHWQCLLQQVGKRMKEKALHHWSLAFYAEVEALIEGFELKNITSLQQQIDQAMEYWSKQPCEKSSQEAALKALQQLEAKLVATLANERKILLDKIQNLYLEQKQHWKKMLHLSGNGIIEYVYNITQFPCTQSVFDEEV